MTFRGLSASLKAVRLILCLAAVVCPLWGQAVAPVRAGLVYHVEGAVVADGMILDPESPRFFQLEPGQVLTTRRGFAEVALGPDRVVRIAPDSEIELVRDDLTEPVVRVRRGAMIVDWDDPKKGAKLRVLTGESAIEISRLGIYRIDARGKPPRLRVYDGRATIEGGPKVSKGREALLSPEPAESVAFDVRRRDFFDRWSARRSRATDRMVRAGSPGKRGRSGAGPDAGGIEASRRNPGAPFGAGPYSQ